MDALRFQIEFFGGPEDGLLVPAAVFPGQTVLVPVGWSASGGTNRADSIPLSARRAQYKFVVSGRGVDELNQLVVSLRYEFVAVHPQQRHCRQRDWRPDRFAARLWRMFARRRDSGPAMSLRARFAAWMLAPIDYPLKVSTAISSTTSSGARPSSLGSHAVS
jgi:hypothetical protein